MNELHKWSIKHVRRPGAETWETKYCASEVWMLVGVFLNYDDAKQSIEACHRWMQIVAQARKTVEVV